MNERGFLEGSEMAGTFSMLRSNDLVWSFVINNYLMGKEPFPFDLLYWNSDSTRMPAKMHSFYLRNMYLKNALKDPGGSAARRRCRSTSLGCGRPRTSSRPSRITSRRGNPRISAPSGSAARCASCSAAPATSPGSSTRRRRRSTATGLNDALPVRPRRVAGGRDPSRRLVVERLAGVDGSTQRRRARPGAGAGRRQAESHRGRPRVVRERAGRRRVSASRGLYAKPVLTTALWRGQFVAGIAGVALTNRPAPPAR